MDNELLLANIDRTCAALSDTLRRKNADYDSSFSKLYKKIGMPYVYGHLSEKIERIWSLMNGDAQIKEEGIRDSLLDLAGYAVLTLAHQRNGEDSPMSLKASRFNIGDMVYKRGEGTDPAWSVFAVSPTFTAVKRGNENALILPQEQDLWVKI